MSSTGLELPINRDGPAVVRRDWLIVLGLGLLVLSSGLGVRDPWPPDEPRFVLVARDMVENGRWLFPEIGGSVYAQKPPLFFWLMAAVYSVTDSLRLAALLPSLLASLGTLLFVYDLGRRLWVRETGLAAALALLFTVQFSLQGHWAQIDAVLCFFTTLSLYALCRCLLLGEGLRWYAIGGVAAGLGVITKGVGFLPLLILLPYAFARHKGWRLPARQPVGKQWLIAPGAMLAVIALWVVPMAIAVAVSSDPQLSAYRDEILFRQTVTRYAASWHHEKPFYYYLEVMLVLWLPLIVLLPWLVPRWRERLRARDSRVLVLLGWVVAVLVFFSVSPGKRGVYLLPALPAFALVAAPWLGGLAQRRDVQRTLFAFTLFFVLACAFAFVYVQWLADDSAAIATRTGLPTPLPVLVIALLGAAGLGYWRIERSPEAWATFLTIVWLIGGWWMMPLMDGTRSARDFARSVERVAAPDRELGLVAFKEQFLLQLRRPTVNFGHARWREEAREIDDAAAWLADDPRRQLLVQEEWLEPCFAGTERRRVGETSRKVWYVVSGRPDPACVARGNAQTARRYVPKPLNS